MALVMALGIMMVLTITLTTVITLTAAGSRDANRTNAGQKAHSLAEAGVNNALAQLSAHYPHYGTPPEDSSWATSPSPVSYQGGTASWSGTFNAGTLTWTLTGTGREKNPTGPGTTDVVRTASAKITVGHVPPPFVRYGLFAGDAAAGCTDLAGGTRLTVAVYVASSCGLIVRGGASIGEPTSTDQTVSLVVNGPLQVSGSLDPSGDKVGRSSRPLLSVRTAGGCPPFASCSPGSATSVYASSYMTGGLSLPMPPVDADYHYGQINGSTAATCSAGTSPFESNTTRDNSLGTVTNLLTRPSFSCTGGGPQAGTLTWNLATKRMTINGAVYIDGNLQIGGTTGMQYSGSGTIYVNGWIWVQGVVCGPGSGWAPASNTCDPKVWDPDASGQGLLFVAANANGPQVAGTPIVSTVNPTADGAVSNWAKVPGGQAWEVVDESPTVSAADYVSSSTLGQQQDLVFPDSLVYNSTATYTLRAYARPGNLRGADASFSTNDSTFGTSGTLVPASTCGPCSLGWYAITITITSQAQLNGFRARFVTTRQGGSGPTAAEVHAVYLEASVPTYTRQPGSLPGCPKNPYCGFWVNSTGAVMEAGSWSIGNYVSDAGTYVGGSVYTDKGYATISGQGNLKAFVNLPPGAPTTLVYNLADSASDFG